MSYTVDNDGRALTETQDGVTMPIDYSFDQVNDFVHGVDVQFEELQGLCLGMSKTFDEIAKSIHYPECWDTVPYPTLIDAIKEIGCNPMDCTHKPR